MTLLLIIAVALLSGGLLMGSAQAVDKPASVLLSVFGALLFGFWLGMVMPAKGSYQDGYQEGIEDCQLNARFTRP